MSQVQSDEPVRLLSEQTLREPHDFWATLRSSQPVRKVDEGIGYYLLSRYEDVSAALRDPATFSSELSRRFKGGVSAYEDTPAVKEVLAQGCPYMGTLNFTDGERHAAHRRAVRRGFTVARVRQLEDVITTIVDELVGGLPFHQEVDLWPRLCVALPIRVITHILGLDPDRAAEVKQWGDAQVARFGQPREDEAENLDIANRVVAMHHYQMGEFDARAREPRDDFLSDMLAGAEADGLSRQELVLIGSQLIVAGAESTASLLGSMIDRLVDSPAQMAALRADRSLIPGAVEETLRTESAIKSAYRFTTRDVEIDGTVIPKDSVVLLLLGSANRDEAMFPEADQFDITRGEASRHLTFGSGIHLCSGAALARSEGRIALGALLDRTSDIVRVHRQDPVHEPDLTVRKLHSLPLVLEPAQ